MEKENKENMLKELKALLEKYNITIGFSCGEGSDTHGIYDENMEISCNKTGRILFSNYGWSIYKGDL